MKYIENFYVLRGLLLMLFVYIFAEVINNIPMRLVVHSYYFSVAFVSLGIFVGMFMYKLLFSLWVSIGSVLVPLGFLIVSRYRYNGGIEHSYDTLFELLLYGVLAEIVILSISLVYTPKRPKQEQ